MHGSPLAALLAASLIAGCAGPLIDDPPADWQESLVSEWEVTIYYPPGWAMIYLPEAGFADISEREGQGELLVYRLSEETGNRLGITYDGAMTAEDVMQQELFHLSDSQMGWSFSRPERIRSSGDALAATGHQQDTDLFMYVAVYTLPGRGLIFFADNQAAEDWKTLHPIYRRIIQYISPE